MFCVVGVVRVMLALQYASGGISHTAKFVGGLCKDVASAANLSVILREALR